jgi:hypothetical protein
MDHLASATATVETLVAGTAGRANAPALDYKAHLIGRDLAPATIARCLVHFPADEAIRKRGGGNRASQGGRRSQAGLRSSGPPGASHRHFSRNKVRPP